MHDKDNLGCHSDCSLQLLPRWKSENAKSLSEKYSSDFIGLRVSAGEEPGDGRCHVHRSSPVTLPEPAANRPEVTLATAPASLAAPRDALHRVPASHLLIAKVMKFLE